MAPALIPPEIQEYRLQPVAKALRAIVGKLRHLPDQIRQHILNEIVHEIQRYLADKAYHVYLPMWPRYITYPSYVKGFRNQDGASLGSRLIYTWFDR